MGCVNVFDTPHIAIYVGIALHAYALCHDGLGYLEESGNVGTLDVVDVTVSLGAIFHAVFVDVIHDAVEIVVNLLTSPAQSL